MIVFIFIHHSPKQFSFYLLALALCSYKFLITVVIIVFFVVVHIYTSFSFFFFLFSCIGDSTQINIEHTHKKLWLLFSSLPVLFLFDCDLESQLIHFCWWFLIYSIDSSFEIAMKNFSVSIDYLNIVSPEMK